MFDFAQLKKITYPLEIETDENETTKLRVNPPTVQDYKKLTFALECKNKILLYKVISELYSDNNKKHEITPQMLYVFKPADIFRMGAGFKLWLKDKREEYHLNIPHYTPKDSAENAGYSLPVMTYEEKIIRDYCGLSFKEINELCVFEYWQLLRDAILYELKKTPGGREMIEEAYCFEQTEPDREALIERGMRVAE